MIRIARFSEKTAIQAHEGTILGADVLPAGTEAPFRHFYGYLENWHAMAGHAHPTDEIYHILQGKGTVIVGGLSRDVEAGDIVVIPANVWHTQLCRDGGPYLWAAYWWEVIPEGRSVPEDVIQVKRFDKNTAFPAHGGTILADDVLPAGLTAPFGHAYGYLDGADLEMKGHKHPTAEIYVICEGKGLITIDEEEAILEPGDVVTIPPEAWHTLKSAGGPLTWFALWWMPVTETRLTASAAVFAAADEERKFGDIPNREASAWLEAHAPLLECPEPDLERIFDFRLWTYRKHIRTTPEGKVITEFLPNVSWAGAYNTINAAAGFHIREGRWLRDTEDIFRSYITFWYRGSGNPRLYTSWLPHAVWDWCCVSGDVGFGVDLLPEMTEEYRAWEAEFMTPCGLFYSDDGLDAMECSISGSGLRPTRNGAMYGAARAIASFAKLAGNLDLEAEFTAKADALREKINKLLWDGDFYRVIPECCIPAANEGTFDFSQVPGEQYVREELGYVPWYFDLPGSEKAIAFTQLLTEEGFKAPAGITTAERRHPRFAFHHEHECLWNGPVWPFATTQTLVGAAKVIRDPNQTAFTKEDYYALLLQYARSHKMDTPDGPICWIDEDMDPFTGRWAARDSLKGWGWPEIYGGYERGRDYNHSMFCDLVLSGLLGIDPSGDMLTADPRIPESWGWFRVQHIPFRGGVYTVQYDRDGSKYGAAGLQITKE